MRIKPILLFTILLFLHILHILEEILGRAWFINGIYGGLKNFIIWMVILFIIPLVFFYLALKKKKVSYYAIYIYAGVMIIDGLTHIIEFIIYKKYFDGSAGIFTGIGFVLIGIPLIYNLKKENTLANRIKIKK